VKANVTFSKPIYLHEAINMARELVEQAVQAKVARISENNKIKWEDHQRNNNNDTHHKHQNRRQEAAKAYVAAPAELKGYLGNRPLCNQCNLHHDGQCPPKCRKCKRIGHQTRDCWSKTPADDPSPTADANA
ncbi:reverse transcriptase domain-containing protein, partial [Tanacetum coccineum]